MRSSTPCILAVPGATCQAIFHAFQTVFYHFGQFSRKGTWVLLLRALHEAERRRVGKDPHPSVAIMDAQSVKTVEESARSSGFDGHKRVKGRKRHLLVDTLGIPISYSVTPANMHDTHGARRLLAGLKYFVPRPEDHLGGQRLSWQGLGRLVQGRGRLGSGKWSGMCLEPKDALFDQRDGSSNGRLAGSPEIGA